MQLETFRGSDTRTVLAQVRETLGDEAMIVRTRRVAGAGATAVEVAATTPGELERFRRRIEAPPVPRRDADRAPAERPAVIALVGPTGAGKTTTIAKLAVHPAAFGGETVGLVTLDTYRVGALEQIQLYADVAGLPLEVVYGPEDVEPALARLRGCAVVLVDTPGRSPRTGQPIPEWQLLLRRLAPDEVHFVVPATLRADVAVGIRDALASCAPTHVLPTKLDELLTDCGMVTLLERLELPARWTTDGQAVPADLCAAGPRLVAAIGFEETAAGAGAA